jgi:hypothetical protein
MHSVDAFISTLVAPAGQRVAEQASRLAAQHEHTKALPRFHTHAQARTHARTRTNGTTFVQEKKA